MDDVPDRFVDAVRWFQGLDPREREFVLEDFGVGRLDADDGADEQFDRLVAGIRNLLSTAGEEEVVDVLVHAGMGRRYARMVVERTVEESRPSVEELYAVLEPDLAAGASPTDRLAGVLYRYLCLAVAVVGVLISLVSLLSLEFVTAAVALLFCIPYVIVRIRDRHGPSWVRE